MSGTSGRTFYGACFCCRFYGAGFVQCQSSDSQVHSIPVPILHMVTDGSCTEMCQEACAGCHILCIYGIVAGFGIPMEFHNAIERCFLFLVHFCRRDSFPSSVEAHSDFPPPHQGVQIQQFISLAVVLVNTSACHCSTTYRHSLVVWLCQRYILPMLQDVPASAPGLISVTYRVVLYLRLFMLCTRLFAFLVEMQSGAAFLGLLDVFFGHPCVHLK